MGSFREKTFSVQDFFESFFNGQNGLAAGWGPPQTYTAHAEIFRQDTPAEAVYFIERGLVKLSRIDRSGQEVIAGLRRRHWIIGAPAALLGKPYSFTNSALTHCTLRCISAAGFMNLVETDKDFNLQILAMLSEEIFTHGKNAVNLGCLPAVDRLKRLVFDILTEMEQPSGQKWEVTFQLPLKHRELAQMVAVTPEHLSRLLGTLERDGLIQRVGSLLKVRDYRALMSECGM